MTVRGFVLGIHKIVKEKPYCLKHPTQLRSGKLYKLPVFSQQKKLLCHREAGSGTFTRGCEVNMSIEF